MDIVKKRQHYVPRTYLKSFSINGRNNDMLWAYFVEQKRICFVAIDDVCVENYLYEHYICYADHEAEFISSNSIENGYMKFENQYRYIIKKIIDSQSGMISLTMEELNILTGFIVSMLFRHPTVINMANDLHSQFYDEHQEWKDQFANQFPQIDETYIKMSFLHRMLEMHQDPDKNLATRAMKNMLCKNQLCVFKSSAGEFVTSDAPIVNIHGDIKGLEYNLIGMPISPEYFVAFIDIDKNVSNKVFVIDNEQIMSINKHQYGHSATGVILSKSKSDLEKQITELNK